MRINENKKNQANIRNKIRQMQIEKEEKDVLKIITIEEKKLLNHFISCVE